MGQKRTERYAPGHVPMGDSFTVNQIAVGRIRAETGRKPAPGRGCGRSGATANTGSVPALQFGERDRWGLRSGPELSSSRARFRSSRLPSLRTCRAGRPSAQAGHGERAPPCVFGAVHRPWRAALPGVSSSRRASHVGVLKSTWTDATRCECPRRPEAVPACLARVPNYDGTMRRFSALVFACLRRYSSRVAGTQIARRKGIRRPLVARQSGD